MSAQNHVTVHTPTMSEHQGAVRLAANIGLPGKVETLWFTCDSRYANGLAAQTCDAFLLAILPLAMRLGLPIKVQGPVSRQLLTNLSDTWMTAASKVMARTRAVPIEVAQPITHDWGGKGVVTGFSAGIDSFCTIIDQPTGAKVTHLLFNNVGSLHLCDVLRSEDKLLAEIATAIDSRGFKVPVSARLLVSLVPNALIHEVLTSWTHADTKYPFGSASHTPRWLAGCLMRTLRQTARASA